jgi:hypothetical protein
VAWTTSTDLADRMSPSRRFPNGDAPYGSEEVSYRSKDSPARHCNGGAGTRSVLGTHDPEALRPSHLACSMADVHIAVTIP